ncbi:fructose-1,6-bisphosphatase/inositol monophosphatase family enzyme [Stella humosa]|uniref:Fructose-1,6-bisphosphatase/inositol monophosphatase family enzyme n=1 Tax=Stella humosa TaxID=94 RepID=A0A3N1MDA9_9PROT|nr:inositol monophosphatase family protein [Stella humosa]ROQ01578.1 fructose-1,6-bisphosphatase/inositol monophosphatase family enzyme [Stella humosa]BBK31958.1 inositol monophosphatase [Stella humosa]
MKVDVPAVAGIIAAVAAEEIVPRFRRLATGDIREKKPGDLVTVADEATEHALDRRFRDLMPGSVVVGEEAVAKDAGILARIEEEAPAWIIDPVDGTANFAAGLPLFAVMVSLAWKGQAIAAWIHDPLTGVMVTAERGEGAWMAGQRLKVAASNDVASMSGAVSFRYGKRPLIRKIAGRTERVGSVFQLRCAGQEYLALTRAQSHFSLYHRLMPWDHAAGQLIHTEAGGVSARLDGSAYRPSHLDGGLLLAPDQASWDAIHRVLVGKPEERV